MRVPFSFLTEQFANSEPIFAALREFLRRCDFTLGEDLAEFERRYAGYCGAKHAIGVGSGTDALFLCLKVLGVGPGDEVITVPNSFIATTGAIVQAGALPVYVDVGDDFNIRVDAVESAVTSRTKAIVPVHWAGYPADLSALSLIANRLRIPVVEDACQALGAHVGEHHVGTFGVAGAFSVHPLKPLHVWGDGGVVVTSSDEVATQLRQLRNHGLEGRDVVRVFGYNSRFDNVQAIVGNHVMDTLPQSIEARMANAARYDEAFGGLVAAGHVRIPPRDRGRKHVFHLYQIIANRRDSLLRFLNEAGVEAKIHYPVPLHLQPAAASLGYSRGQFPQAELQSSSTVTLPCHQFLSPEQIDYVIERVVHFYENEPR